MSSSPPSSATETPQPESNRTVEIRAVAAELFLRSGFAATTMNDIADAAGILPGSLYHHFVSKEKIAVEILSAFNDDLIEMTAQAPEQITSASPEQGLRQLMERSAEMSMRHAAAIRLRSYEAPSTSTDRLTEVLNFDDSSLIETWRTVVEATVKDATPPVDAGLLRFGLAHMALDSGTAYPRGTDVAAIADQVCDLFLRGLSLATPPDAELDASLPMQTAHEIVAGWSAADGDADDDRAGIIRAARSEFARRGYAATTIRDIAEAAQVRMGTMYRRVSSKEAMLVEILDGYSQILTDSVSAVASSDGTPVEKLDAIAYLLVNTTRSFPDEAMIVKFGWNGHEVHGPFHNYALQTQERLAAVESVLVDGIAAGEFRPLDDTAQTAFLVRRALWLRYQDFEAATTERTHHFLRRSLLRPTIS